MPKSNLFLPVNRRLKSFDSNLVLFLMFVAILVVAINECTEVLTVRFEADDLEELYFEIISPEELRYSYKIILAKNFGSNFKRTYSNIGLVPADPIESCGTPYNVEEIKNNIVLVQRGECSFVSKAIQAEKAGALGVIIMDSSLDNDNNYVHMIDDDTNRHVNIPAAFLLGKNGFIITNTLKTRNLEKAVINIPLNLSTVPQHKRKQPPWLLW